MSTTIQHDLDPEGVRASSSYPHIVRGSGSSRTSGPGPAPWGRAAARPSRGRPSRGHGQFRDASGEDGFTLVELLVVVLVLATLVGIAVPTFVQQRESAWDAAVSSELRSAAIALESSRAQNQIYTSGVLDPGAGWGFESSSAVALRYRITADTYCLRAWFVPESDAPAPTAGFADMPSTTPQLWDATPSAGVSKVEGRDRAVCD